MSKQITFSTSPTSASFSEFEKQQTSSATFHDILPPQCITTADHSAHTYYGQPKFKGGIRRFTDPAANATAKIDVSYTERQKQTEKSSAIRRSTLQTPKPTMRSVKSSKKGGSAFLSRLFSKSSKKRDEGGRQDTLYECDSESDEGTGTHKASL